MNNLNLMICGEGPSDVGKLEYGTGVWISGPAIAYVQRAFKIDASIKAISRNDLLHGHRHRLGKIRSKKGHAVKAERLAKLARREGCQVAICYIDCDRNDFEVLYKDVCLGFDKSNTNIVGIPMLPKPMIESWLMGDSNAYLSVFGRLPSNPPLPIRPEELRGNKSDPTSNYAKNYLSRVLSQYPPHQEGWSFEIAQNSNPDTLCYTCPTSYGRFLQDVLCYLSTAT